MKRTVTTLKKGTVFGYIIEVQFIQDNYNQGGITYECITTEIWNDGHITYPITSYLRPYIKFSNKEEGNREYKRLINDGFQLVNKETFTPTEMDMR